jgi:hypothetical protein
MMTTTVEEIETQEAAAGASSISMLPVGTGTGTYRSLLAVGHGSFLID